MKQLNNFKFYSTTTNFTIITFRNLKHIYIKKQKPQSHKIRTLNRIHTNLIYSIYLTNRVRTQSVSSKGRLLSIDSPIGRNRQTILNSLTAESIAQKWASLASVLVKSTIQSRCQFTTIMRYRICRTLRPSIGLCRKCPLVWRKTKKRLVSALFY